MALGGGLALISHSPKCRRIFLMTSGSSMKLNNLSIRKENDQVRTYFQRLIFKLFVAAVLGVLAMSGVMPGLAEAQTSEFTKRDFSRFTVWVLATELLDAAVVYYLSVAFPQGGFPEDAYEDRLETARFAAAKLNLEIPPFPERTGDSSNDGPRLGIYLIENPVLSSVGAKYPGDHSALFRLAGLLNYLSLMHFFARSPYEDPKSFNIMMTLIRTIERAGQAAELPSQLWEPVVAKVKSRGSEKEIFDVVKESKTNVTRYLEPPE